MLNELKEQVKTDSRDTLDIDKDKVLSDKSKESVSKEVKHKKTSKRKER